MMRIAFFNNKGGVGKSTAVINVAHRLSKLGKQVLVCDCDDQRNTFEFFRNGTGDDGV
jgi:chromosome partitioning protein